MTIAQEAMCLYCFLPASGLTFLIFNCSSLLFILHLEKSKLKPPHGGGLVGLFICASVSCELGDELCEVVAPLVELFLFCLLLWRLDEAIVFYPALVAVYYYRVGGQQLDAGKAVARLQVIVLDCFNESVTYMQLCF